MKSLFVNILLSKLRGHIKMKKILSILMAGLLSIGLVACFSKEDTARRGENHNKSEVEIIRKVDTRNEGKGNL